MFFLKSKPLPTKIKYQVVFMWFFVLAVYLPFFIYMLIKHIDGFLHIEITTF